MRAVRAALPADRRRAASERISEFGLSFCGVPPPAIIAAYAPINDELSPSPLLKRLRSLGYRIALPRMTSQDAPLNFHLYEPGDTLISTKWGIEEPAPAAPCTHPDVVLVPLLAFSTDGARLGYGGGYYDRTLARLRQRDPAPPAIGLAFDEQMVDAIPTLNYDLTLDWILTPTGPLRVAN